MNEKVSEIKSLGDAIIIALCAGGSAAALIWFNNLLSPANERASFGWMGLACLVGFAVGLYFCYRNENPPVKEAFAPMQMVSAQERMSAEDIILAEKLLGIRKVEETSPANSLGSFGKLSPAVATGAGMAAMNTYSPIEYIADPNALAIENGAGYFPEPPATIPPQTFEEMPNFEEMPMEELMDELPPEPPTDEMWGADFE